MFCSKCGQQIADNSAFCPACGQPCAPNPQAAAAPNPYARPAEPQAFQPAPQDVQQAYQAYQQPAQPGYQAYTQPQPAYTQPQPAYTQPQPAYQQPVYAQPAYQPGGSTPVTAKKSSAKKGIFIGLGCLLLALLIGGGIWFLTRRNADGPLEKLKAPAEKSLSELSSYVEDLPNLHAIVSNIEDMDGADGLHMAVKSVNQYVYNYNGNREVYGSALDLIMDMNQADGRALVTGTYSGSDVSIPFTLYLDKEELRLASSALLEENEAVVIPLDNLVQRWNASSLARLTEFTLPEDLDLSGITDANLEKGLKAAYGDDWEKFAESVDLVPYTGTPHFAGSGETYTLSWDSATLSSMYNRTDVDLDNLLDVDDLDDLSRIDMSDISAKAIVAFLGELDKVLQDSQFYMENDRLMGVYVKAGPAGDKPMVFEFRLIGENNPWEHITAAVTENYSSYTVTERFDMEIKKTPGQLRIEFTSRREDSEGAEYSYTEGPYVLVYNDADGRITFEADGEVYDEGIRLLPADGGFTFSVDRNEDGEYYSYVMGSAFTFSTKVGSISAPGTKTIDLLALSDQELQDLMTRIQQKAQSMGAN